MGDVIIAAVFGLIALAASFLTGNLGQPRKDLRDSEAVIERIADPDTDVIYYVKVKVDGQWVEGKSITYHSSQKYLQVGDRVPVQYYMTGAGWPRVIFRDPELSDNSGLVRKVPLALRWAAMAFFALAVIFLIV